MSFSTQVGLKEQLHPLIRDLATGIEATWQRWLNLEPYAAMPADLGYIEGKLEGERLQIENRCYQSREFRKLHLELARVGNNLDILHCVLFPRTTFDLPMFGADLVGGRGQISAAIVDLSPTTIARELSNDYIAGLTALPNPTFQGLRELPTWGDIFSSFCLFIRPGSPEEEAAFLDRALGFLQVHCQQAAAATALTDPEAIATVLEQQRYYCEQQRRNDKTRRVLEKAFGEDWADRYMTTMLFDLPSD
ncbi:phycocyanobilin:ferredoxin oxidoreductase [Synechococcus elongatus]|uniref:phycocyanobilin:ferredoxin oxidoreductase n=1 Tax=Synechococcus elongatus TaxID=32046 RepID=UPI000F7D5C13|nr:phycocyanobilin:ferredoxin oxidoreductase [Synechococcus elongatus]